MLEERALDEIQICIEHEQDGVDEDVLKGTFSYEHERLAFENVKLFKTLTDTSVSALEETLKRIEQAIKDLGKSLPDSCSGVSTFLSSSTKVSETESVLPILLAQFRRHYRDLTTLTCDSKEALSTFKTRRVAADQVLLDAQLQLKALQKQILMEQYAVPTPKFSAVLPMLCSKEDFLASLRGNVDGTKESFCAASLPSSVEHTFVAANEVQPTDCCSDSNEYWASSDKRGEKPSTACDHQGDVTMSAADTPSCSGCTNKVLPEKETIEEFYLSWLKYDLACRAKASAEIESVRTARQAAEEKLKLFQKSEADLAAKLSPLEKDISRLISTMDHTAPSAILGLSSKLSSPLVFSQKAYSLSPPLLTIFTKLFCYKAVNGDLGVETRLVFQPVGKISDPLYETDPGRLQVVIDKATTLLPPSTFPKAAALFPLSIRFCYFPKLNVVSAMCQFPRVIGSDVTFLADLFFENDEGNVSPNPLHHVATDLTQLLASDDATVSATPRTPADKEANPPTLSRTIASRISELQLGRVYRWTHLLADVKFNVDPSSIASLSGSTAREKAACVTAAQFVKRFRTRASHRAWVLYLEENLKANPKEIPPPAVTLPPALEAASISAASMYQLFSPSSATEFFFAGGSRSGVVASKDRDVHFLKAELNVRGVVFNVFFAIPLDGRPSEVCFFVKSFTDTPEAQRCFSLARKLESCAAKELDTLALQTVLNDSFQIEEEKERRVLEQCIAAMSAKQNPCQTPQPNSFAPAHPSDIAGPRQLWTFLETLNPASAYVSGAAPKQDTCSASPLESFRSKWLYFREPSLTAIQDSVTSSVFRPYTEPEPSVYSHITLIVQLVCLSAKLNRWVRDIFSHGFLSAALAQQNDFTPDRSE